MFNCFSIILTMEIPFITVALSGIIKVDERNECLEFKQPQLCLFKIGLGERVSVDYRLSHFYWALNVRCQI